VPFHEAEPATISRVVPAANGGRFVRLGHVVGQDDDPTVGSAVRRRGLERREQVRLGCREPDGVVDEHPIEAAVEPERPHVARDELGADDVRTCDGQHRFRYVGEREAEVRCQMRGEAPAATAQLQQGRVAIARVEQTEQVCRLLAVLRRRREERPPLGKVGIHAHG
jgi:hypothetical protein